MTIDERLEKVESQLARIRLFNQCLIGCLFLFMVVWLMWKSLGPGTVWAQSGVKEIRSNAFILEDENMKRRASLDFFLGEPQLKMFDKNGNTLVILTTVKGFPTLQMLDKNNNERIALAMLGSPSLRLSGENGYNNVELSLRETPSLVMFDESGELRVRLAVDREQTSLSLRDKKGKLIWSAP